MLPSSAKPPLAPRPLPSTQTLIEGIIDTSSMPVFIGAQSMPLAAIQMPPGWLAPVVIATLSWLE